LPDENRFRPGFPQWTELDQQTGLDPLGMQRPTEMVYQSLLPGISSITLRLRYYSFFPWIIDAYAHRNGSTDMEIFRVFQRRAEALYALVCAHGEKETGIAGINWAIRKLEKLGNNPKPEQIIAFADGADMDSNSQNRYLKNKGGAFGGIYASQLRQLNLVYLDDPEILVPNCTNTAMPLVGAMQSEMGELADLFFDTIDQGSVTIETLDKLKQMKPSQIRPNSAEHEALTAVLTGRQDSATASDELRRQTMLELLKLSQHLGKVPVVDEAKWHWFKTHSEKKPTGHINILQFWSLYQASDLMRLAYEGILSTGLRLLNNAPMSRQTFSVLVSDIVDAADLDSAASLSDFLNGSLNDFTPASTAHQATLELLEAERIGESSDEIRAALRLIVALWNKRRDYPKEIMERLQAADHFQSYETEFRFFEELIDQPVRDALGKIIATRVIKRHLWVASRKFRNQKAYTFLMEPDDGMLRYRTNFIVDASSPRIGQALQFLRDAKLLDDNGLTPWGRSEIER
jgi:hypothetical protein